MLSSQLEYPLTLAEVLFEELETTCANSAGTDWCDVEERINEIRTLQTATPEEPTDVIWASKQALSAKLVPQLHQIIHRLPQKRSALCLSGGGVQSAALNLGVLQALLYSAGPKAPHLRSATFNLGVLQGLAHSGLLDKFDYLSTVSGGGFIGSWLTAWIHRENGNVSKVVKQLVAPPHDSLKPEPTPLHNLRRSANYLTPERNLNAIDRWTLIAIYLRNLLLNWMVFVPVIMAYLILPRIWFAFVKSSYWESYFDSRTLLAIGFLGAAFALGYIGTNLPGSKLWNFHEREFIRFCLLPLVISAMALTTYWFRLGTGRPAWWRFIVFALALGMVPWGFSLVVRLARREWQGSLAGYLAATVLLLVAFSLCGFLIWYVTNVLNLHERYFSGAYFARAYASLALPFFLVLLTIGGAFIAGFTSRFTDVDDQEWWTRSGAGILIMVVGWTVLHLLVLFGPGLLVGAQQDLVNLVLKESWAWNDIKGIAAAVVGFLSGAITLFGGYIAKTPTHGERDEPPSWKGKVLSIATSVAAIVFAAFIVIALALATNWILTSNLGDSMATLLGAGHRTMDANDARSVVYDSPGRVLLVFMFAIAVVGWLLGRFINTNRFSLHYYWRNRIMRVYLGVSRDEQERENTRNKFTDFDLQDNINMGELKQKPLHVFNITLNREARHRKRESFTVSSLHAGGYWLGYRNTENYGGDNGISLATCAAISGSGVRPKTGEVLISPIVRFIMILFNVRFGFWLGNPGIAGSNGAFTRDSPTQSVRPIFEEALGQTNASSPYVYLSDGGDFENLGLYEMVLRRCRFIVVSDVSTDPDCKFQSLARAIRQIRMDLGVPIEMSQMHFGIEPDKTNNYCALGKIRYSAVDKLGNHEPDANYDGVLIYIKPSLNGSEPTDVLNYHNENAAFPQDSIGDQEFGDEQFESYRMLGSHMIKTISSYSVNTTLFPFERFEQQAKLHLRLN